MRQSRNNKARLWLVAIIAVLAICSCDETVVYDSYRHISTAGWERNDTLVYDVKPVAHSGNYTEELGLRLDGNYPFMQLWMVVEQTILPSRMVHTDTVTCDVTTHNGTPLGHGVNLYQHAVPIGSVSLAEGDSLHIVVRHCMRRELLSGISEVGVKLSRE